jgi:hypothetical protein
MTYLMLAKGSNLRINGLDGGAQHALKPNTSGVTLKGSENKGISLPNNVARGLCVCERLVGCCLVETIGIGDFSLANCRGSVSK